MGIGNGGLGIGDWGLGPIPNPQSPIPNPQSPQTNIFSKFIYNKKKYISNYIINLIIYTKHINIYIIRKYTHYY